MFRTFLGETHLLKKRHIYMCLLIFIASGCVSLEIPHYEYNLSQSAFRSATDSEAGRYAPNLYHKAERYYKRAEELFLERDFDKAVLYFKKARAFSERSENVARLKQFQSGDLE